MGTHPIFESDFDCLTDRQLVDFGVLGKVKALRRLRQLDENSKRTKMSQPGITQFTRRVTRRQTAAQQKQTLLDRDNSNIISLSDKTTKLVPISPRKSESKPLHITSPAKIRKTS